MSDETPRKTLSLKLKPKSSIPTSETLKQETHAPPANVAAPPRKTLSLGAKPAVQTFGDTQTPVAKPTLTRGGKRIVRREDVQGVQKAGTIKTAPPKLKKPKPKRPHKPRKPQKSPSDIRAKEVNDSLNAYPVWLHYQPLAVGVERQIFQHIAKHALSASKRVVQKMLLRHTTNKRYLAGIVEGAARFNLDGTEAGRVLPHEQVFAVQKLAGLGVTHG